ncbi:MAG TPA: hypothetical protein VMU89_14775 [Thermomicrobiaceae bacterium]|nr:hypothetical protein [Thermomicrobiaceae bacterium]
MADIKPTRLWDVNVLSNMKQSAIDNVQAIAQAGGAGRDVIWRPINVNDVLYGPQFAPGYSGSNAAALTNPNAPTANVWLTNQFPLFTTLQTQAIAITGWESLSPIPHLKAIFFWVGSEPYSYIPIQSIYGYPETEGFFTDVLYWGGQDTPRIDLLFDASLGANAEEFMIKGYIAEPAGKLQRNSNAQLATLISSNYGQAA